MKPHWDADSPELRRNLAEVLAALRRQAAERVAPTAGLARDWHRQTMDGLAVPDPGQVGVFRGEPGLVGEDVGLYDRFGRLLSSGTPAAEVAAELQAFESRLAGVLADLDGAYPPGARLGDDDIAAIVDVAAWAHAEWVRIHPFMNGNGRSARLWANFVLLRYGVPPAIRLRPRPDGGYGLAAARAMEGDWEPTAAVFRRMLDDELREGTR